MKLFKAFSYILLGMLLGLVIVLITASICYSSETKDWKFLEYGTYMVPEDFPDKFLEFPARLLAKESIAGKATMGVVGHQSEPTSAGDTLLVLVAYYSPNDVIYVLAIKTVSAKSVTCTYIDRQLLETGKSSFILTKSDEMLDFGKFRKEREVEFGKVRI